MGTGLKVLRNYLMLFRTPSLPTAQPTLFGPKIAVHRSSGTERRKKKVNPSQNKSVEGKSRSCLPGARMSSVRVLRKTARVGVGTKSSTKTKTKVAPKPPNKQPSTPALPPSSQASQAGPSWGQGLHAGPTPPDPQPIYKIGARRKLTEVGPRKGWRDRCQSLSPAVPPPRAGDDGAGEKPRGPSHECCSLSRKGGREGGRGGREERKEGKGEGRGHEGGV